MAGRLAGGRHRERVQPYCSLLMDEPAVMADEIFGPILKSVSDKFGLAVLAVSMDGGPTASFPEYVVDAGQYERLGLGNDRQVPAMVLFDSVTKRPMPIGYGILSQDEIMDRVFQLTQVRPGSDY